MLSTFVNTASTAAHRIVPNQSVYAGTKTAVRVISEGLRQESKDRFAMPPEAVARAIAFAIEQPADIDVGEVVVRPTAQG
jgi:NADP-dependent 3-hydroxy acid dehydrogenase YdfG